MRIYPPQGWRKWWLGALALILSGTFVLLGLLKGNEWNVALGLTLGIDGLSNVGEHFTKRGKKDADA